MIIKRMLVGIATAAITITTALATAYVSQAAEITTSNDASSEGTSYEGTSNAAVDHMAGEPNDGNVEGDTPKTVLRAFHIPVLDANGNVVTDQWGNPVTTIDWRIVPVGDGAPQATIVHN